MHDQRLALPSTRGLKTVAAAFLLVVCAGCGDDGGPSGTNRNNCGNGVVDGTEECDGTDGCADNCEYACGNGVLDVGELCDTEVAAGAAGACPTSCAPGDACSTVTLREADCQTACVQGELLARIDGDSCCQFGATSIEDDDCTPVCGNGVVEVGETCDRLIPTGGFACPAAEDCTAAPACTTAQVVGTGTCAAACDSEELSMPSGTTPDGCCPDNATAGTDVDCTGTCGDNAVTDGETCDTGASSLTPCPTCPADADPCTVEHLLGAGTCHAECWTTEIVAPANGDGCCPPGAHSGIDNDCDVECPNGVVETGEECDDANEVAGDGCDMCVLEGTPASFRFTSLQLRDPHILTGGSCGAMNDFLNGLLTGFLKNDSTADTDSLLDLSFVAQFAPLNQQAVSTAFYFFGADCTAPVETTVCSLPEGSDMYAFTASNKTSGQCSSIVAGTTTSGYGAAPTVPSAGSSGCFETNHRDVELSLSVVVLQLREVTIAAAYSGNPADQLVNGLIRGFLPETDAQATSLPADWPLVGGKRLSELLAGGAGSCATHDERDSLSDSTRGWWVYINFTAEPVDVTE